MITAQVRVYVDGQLAGVYPIYYTMYTVSEILSLLCGT